MDSLTPIDKFLINEGAHPQKIYLKQPLNQEWIDFSWKDVGTEARKVAQAIIDLKLPPKSHIGLISKNCAHWIIVDLGIWMAGHISVPLFPTTDAETIKYVLEHAGVDLLFVGKLDEWEKQKSGVPGKIKKIEFPYWSNDGCEKWSDFIGDRKPIAEIHKPKPEEICTIIYTSGTTGKPKGVVHTFHSASVNASEAIKKISLDEKERFMSYLPLSHVAERVFVEMGSLYCAGTVYFAESIESFLGDINTCQPTLFLGVPKIWIKMQQGVLKKLNQKKLNILLAIPLINRLIRKKIKTSMGFAQCKYFFCGAAILPTEIKAWYRKLDIEIFECYGMTENFAVGALGLPGHNRLDAIGKVFEPKTQIKIDSNGEVLIHSEANMQGYFKDPETTAKMLDKEGWLHTGDQGVISDEGYLKIVGRTKDAFKTLKGKYITPDKIESLFYKYEHFENVCVMGVTISNPIAVVNLAVDSAKKDKETLEKELSVIRAGINSGLANNEKISHIVVDENTWTVDRGLMTPTLKIKRNHVEALCNPLIEDWAANESKDVIFFKS